MHRGGGGNAYPPAGMRAADRRRWQDEQAAAGRGGASSSGVGGDPRQQQQQQQAKPVVPSNTTLTSIFRLFDADHSSRVNFKQFLELITALLTVQDNVRPDAAFADHVARDIARNMTITDVNGRVVQNVHHIALSDFILACNGPKGRANLALQMLLDGAVRGCQPRELLDTLCVMRNVPPPQSATKNKPPQTQSASGSGGGAGGSSSHAASAPRTPGMTTPTARGGGGGGDSLFVRGTRREVEFGDGREWT